jgi:heme a synthase
MESGSGARHVFVSAGHRGLLLAAAFMTWALVSMGGAVCMTGDGLACADWPRCEGGLTPPARLDAITEYTHRLFAITTFPLLLIMFAVARWRYRPLGLLQGCLSVAAVLFVAVGTLGAVASVRGLPRWVAAIDVGAALAALALVVAAAVVAHAGAPGAPLRLAFRDGFVRLGAAALGATFAVLVTGVLVSAPQSLIRCIGWPLYEGGALTAELGAWSGGLRRLLALAAALLIAWVFVQAWRTQRHNAVVFRSATGAASVLAAVLAVGALLPALGFPLPLRILYVSLAAALWTLLTVVWVSAALAAAARDQAGPPVGRGLSSRSSSDCALQYDKPQTSV